MKFWTRSEKNRARWEAITAVAEDPVIVTSDLLRWIARLTKAEGLKPVCCASPCGYDWPFARYYMIALGHIDETPFGHRCFDARSHAMGILGTPYLQSGKNDIPQEWRPKDLPHTHDAGDDSLEQAGQFINQMKAHIERPRYM